MIGDSALNILWAARLSGSLRYGSDWLGRSRTGESPLTAIC